MNVHFPSVQLVVNVSEYSLPKCAIGGACE